MTGVNCIERHSGTSHKFVCGICGEMLQKREDSKTCFFEHLISVEEEEEVESRAPLEDGLV